MAYRFSTLETSARIDIVRIVRTKAGAQESTISKLVLTVFPGSCLLIEQRLKESTGKDYSEERVLSAVAMQTNPTFKTLSTSILSCLTPYLITISGCEEVLGGAEISTFWKKPGQFQNC
jgi:hypothetical protein